MHTVNKYKAVYYIFYLLTGLPKMQLKTMILIQTRSSEWQKKLNIQTDYEYVYVIILLHIHVVTYCKD